MYTRSGPSNSHNELLFSLLLFFFFLFSSITCLSDTYGQNPQHEFGSVVGVRSAPLLPFWQLTGDAFANHDLVRIVPDRQSKKGGLWNTEPNRFQNWEITYKIKIHGVSVLGADGIALWYVKEKGKTEQFFLDLLIDLLVWELFWIRMIMITRGCIL